MMTRHYRTDVRSARSADELLALAGPAFSFTTEARQAMVATPDGGYVEAPGQVIVRTDTNEALSIVGSRFVPAQVRDFLAPLDPMLRSGQLVPVSATAFDRGTTRAVELQLPEPIVLPGPNGTEDVLLRRVIWRDTIDGSSRLSLKDALLRRWCKNGATEVIGMAGAFFRHTAKKMAEALDMTSAIEESARRFTLVERNARRLLATPFAEAQMARVAEELYPEDEEGEVTPRSRAARLAIVQLFNRGEGNFGRTAWDAVNAVTEWSTHHRPVRGQEQTLSRLRSVWMGDSQAEAGIAYVAHEAGLTFTGEGELVA